MGRVPPEISSGLCRLLGRQTAFYRELLQLLRREKEALLRQTLPDLSETNRLKQDLIAEIQQAEAERQQIVSELASALGVLAAEITLSKLAAFPEMKGSAELSECGLVLSSLLGLCQDISRQNLILLEHSFDLVGGLISAIADSGSGPLAYLPTGQVQSGKTSPCLVERRA
jgi:flagellar biosynthesis/type III secretory pathway chaperone